MTYVVSTALCAFVIHWAIDQWRYDVLLVGDVTRDIVGDRVVAGGAVTYAAAVASGLHRRACVITAAAHDADLSIYRNHELYVVPSNATLTFEHTYTWFGNQRKLRVPALPNVTLSSDHVPLHCLLAKTILIGPLVPTDVDAESFTRPHSWLRRLLLRNQRVGLMAQGFQRHLDEQGHVTSLKQPSLQLLRALTQQVLLFMSDVETDPWAKPVFDDVVSRVGALIVTRGEKGAAVYRATAPPLDIPALQIDAVDTNGAGDTFATAFMLSLQAGWGFEAAGLRAAWAASRVCLQPQACKPACCTVALHAIERTARNYTQQTSNPAVLPVLQPDTI